MKKLNRTYVMGAVFIVLGLFVLWQSTMIPTRLVSNEPGPKLFPYISGAGMIVMSVLSMIFDAPKDKADQSSYLDKDGWKRVALIFLELIIFGLAMKWIGFWFASMIGMFAFIMTLRAGKKINLIFAIVLSVLLGSICYFGFTKGFSIPLPKGELWDMMGIKMP